MDFSCTFNYEITYRISFFFKFLVLIIAYLMIKMEFAEYLFLPIAEIKNEMISACISKHDNLKENFFF